MPVAAAIVVAAASPAHSEDWVATKPGVMCTSAETLGRLTLPGGDSRTHASTPRPEDFDAATAGGCIDILLGATVTVQKTFKNTALITYDGATYMVPAADFLPATETTIGRAPDLGTLVPPGYTITQRVPTGDAASDLLVMLEDRRITPAVRSQMWRHSDDADILFGEDSAISREWQRRPLLNAQLFLVSATGAVIAKKQFERALAAVEQAPVHGLSTPTFLLTIDYSAGFGGYSGPFSQLLAPAERRLDPVEAVNARGQSGPIALASTLHAGWKVVPSRRGGTEEIEEVSCASGKGTETSQLYETYRYDGSRWTVISRQHGECSEIEVFPPRGEFP